ncbi:hypothetical protein MANES_10G124912v8 [Manihot esculenta]|uniref:Uncharacterized protein n=1 Tax=Manihot esculenta TaxID=3983 RepID=A0ACB7H059_MANES|nr:hypothetical protein MANES_10G124912v8 [Manihot esculenta]
MSTLEVLFTKKLTDTDFKHRMAVPMETYQLGVFSIPEGEFSKEFDFIDVDDNSVKKFTCCKRIKGHPKPEFRKGWTCYVKEKHLVEGDEVIFYKEEDETGRITFKIQAKRNQCLLFGQDLRNRVRASTYSR